MLIQELIFASNNAHKVEELKAICPNDFTIISLADAGIGIDIEEPYFTLEENAKEKCRVIQELTKKNCFAEDTGLEVLTLNNEPGVFSARYAGVHGDSVANMDKLLGKMEGVQDRAARFRTVICLYYAYKYHFFEGICAGTIATHKKGMGGFGYDPIFIPNGYDYTFSEMDKALKNNISHRKIAFEKLFIFLNKIDQNN
jgi:XTP/dITP diphosphohydrolase